MIRTLNSGADEPRELAFFDKAEAMAKELA